MPRNVVSALDAHLIRLDQEFLDAIEFLKTRPGWLSAKVMQHERLEAIVQARLDDEANYGSDARLQFVLRLFDGRAEPYLQLVEDTPTQEAYFAMLGFFTRIAWRELTGGHPLAPPADPYACDQQNAINLRSHSWATKAYRRLLEQKSGERFEHDGATAGTNGGLVPTGRQVEVPFELKISVATKAERRGSFVIPILEGKGMNPRQWAAKAGYVPTVAYGYLSGKTNPRLETRKNLADVLGVEVAELPG